MNTPSLPRRSYRIIAVLVLLIAPLSFWRMTTLQAEQTLAAPSPKATKVRVAEVSRHALTEWAFAEGTVQAARREYLQLETAGIVTELGSVDGQLIREGTQVRGPRDNAPGDLLMRIDTRTQTAEQQAVLAQVIEARTAMEQAEREFTRAQKIFERQLISQNEFETYRATRDARRAAYNAALAQRDRSQVSLDKAVLRAPFDGIITRVNVREGDFYTGAKPAASDNERELQAAIVLMDTGQFEATLNLPLWDDTQVATGQRVYLAGTNSVLAHAAEGGFAQGAFATGYVQSISPSISLDKRAITVKVLTESGEQYLRDGAFVTAWIVTREREAVLAIPDSAIANYESGSYVYVHNPDQQTVTQQPVTLGSEGQRLVEILDGLGGGERIVIEGGRMLTQDAPVMVVGE